MHKLSKAEKATIVSKDIKNNLQRFTNIQEVIKYCKQSDLSNDEI